MQTEHMATVTEITLGSDSLKMFSAPEMKTSVAELFVHVLAMDSNTLSSLSRKAFSCF